MLKKVHVERKWSHIKAQNCRKKWKIAIRINVYKYKLGLFKIIVTCGV